MPKKTRTTSPTEGPCTFRGQVNQGPRLTAARSSLRHLRLVLLIATALSLNLLPTREGAADFPRKTAVVRAVENVSPAVVNISSEYEIVQRSNPFFDLGVDPFFERFFRDFFEPDTRQRYKRNSLGSGVIIDGTRGYILTNEHVIARSARIKVAL